MTQMKALVDKLLTNVSSAYQPQGLICELVLPVIQSKNFTGKLAKYGTNHLRLVSTVVGGKGKFRRVETQTRTSDSYSIEGHGLEGMVTKEDYANVEAPFDAERDETMGLSSILLLEKEKALGDVLTDTAIITQNVTLSGSDQFSDYLNSDPLGVFATARGVIMTGCGAAANAAIVPWFVAEKLRFHPQVLDALGFKYARPGGLNDDELAKALNVKKIFIPEAMYESANEGQTSVLAPIWGKHVVFLVAPDSAQPMQVSAGYRVQLSGSPIRKVTKWDVNNPDEAKAILVSDYYDMFLSNVKAVYLIKDAIA